MTSLPPEIWAEKTDAVFGMKTYGMKDPDENEHLAVKLEKATLIQEPAAKIYAVYPGAKTRYQQQQAEGKTGRTAGEARK
jgi:hypothetical protein